MIQKRLRYYWMILSFQSGVINSAGFVLFSVYLTHMTGIFSKIGLEAEQWHTRDLVWWLSIPLAFLAGALVSTVWIEGQARKNNNPRYEWLFSLMSICMFVIGFETSLSFTSSGVVWIVAFCAGAQNAIFNERTGAIMRTTHLTGTTTDLGISLARVVFKTLGNDAQRLSFETKLISLRCTSIGCFVLGSVVGSLLAFRYAQNAFWLPGVVYLAMAYDSTKVLKVLQAKR